MWYGIIHLISFILGWGLMLGYLKGKWPVEVKANYFNYQVLAISYNLLLGPLGLLPIILANGTFRYGLKWR